MEKVLVPGAPGLLEVQPGSPAQLCAALSRNYLPHGEEIKEGWRVRNVGFVLVAPGAPGAAGNGSKKAVCVALTLREAASLRWLLLGLQSPPKWQVVLTMGKSAWNVVHGNHLH